MFKCTQHTIATVRFNVKFGQSADQFRNSLNSATDFDVTLSSKSPNALSGHFHAAAQKVIDTFKSSYAPMKLLSEHVKSRSLVELSMTPMWLIDLTIKSIETSIGMLDTSITSRQQELRDLTTQKHAQQEILNKLKSANVTTPASYELLIQKARGKWQIDPIHNGISRADLIMYALLTESTGLYVSITSDGMMSLGEFSDLLPNEGITEAVFDKALWTAKFSDLKAAKEMAFARFML
jgi:hypothetical protein